VVENYYLEKADLAGESQWYKKAVIR
jgi:hypothetical protein